MGTSNFRIGISRLRAHLHHPWLLPDLVLGYLINSLRGRIVFQAETYSWLYAILYHSYFIDGWLRLARTAQQINALDTLDKQQLRILDVGGGGGAINNFLSPANKLLCNLDINIKDLRRSNIDGIEAVAADGCHLPFHDDSFDIVVSVHTLEHVPEVKKIGFCSELKRVARNYVIINCPADSTAYEYKGTLYDTKFLQQYRQRFKKDEPYTIEHLNSGLPKVAELTTLFPGATISGQQNVDVWLRYMTLGFLPYIRFISGVYYKIFLASKENLPPYHACLLVYKKI